MNGFRMAVRTSKLGHLSVFDPLPLNKIKASLTFLAEPFSSHTDIPTLIEMVPERERDIEFDFEPGVCFRHQS